MSTYLPLLAYRLIGRPLLILPEKAQIIFAALEGRIVPDLPPGDDEARVAVEGGGQPEASRFVGGYDPRRSSGQFVRAAGRTALITIDGSLVNRGAWLDSRSGLTSYEGLAAQVDAAAADPDIDNIVLDINSPGGEAGGMFGLAAKIRAVRSSKKIVAVVNDMAASAGYGIASQADEIVISPTSIVGSIGVVMLHLDRSAEMQRRGIKPTLIHAGAHKVDGNSFEALSESVRAELQDQVEATLKLFVEAVAAGRGGRLTTARARGTEARIFIGRDAIAAGLADRIGSLDDVLADLNRAAPRAPASTPKGKIMDNSYDDGIARNARTAERQRIGAILRSAEAEGRADAALRLATETDMSAEAATSMLATFPRAAATPSIPTIEERQQGRQEIGASGKVETSADAVKAGWAKSVAEWNAQV
jgi:signal peptide peptidase SppA